MYVLCFRMKSIIDIPRLKSQISAMPLRQIFVNHLEPFKVNHFLETCIVCIIFPLIVDGPF